MNEHESRIEKLKLKASRLPMEPGVYIMRNSSGEIIYVGKAVHLKNRVSQYFGYRSDREEKVRRMVANVEDFEYIVCDSEFEALILECSLIKQHTPKYNILLKDDKGYHYIKINTEGWGSISAVMQKTREAKNIKYIGPYNSFATVKKTIDEAKRIYKLPQCKKEFPRDVKPGRRPCLNYDLGICAAPCNGSMKESEYKEALDSALSFIKNDSATTIKSLKSEMQKASDNLEFEKAAKLRDRINAIESIKNRQKMVAAGNKRQDIFAFAVSPEKIAFQVFIFRDGHLSEREQFLFDRTLEDADAFGQFIMEYYIKRGDIPGKIYTETDFEGREVLSRMFSEDMGRKIEIIVPKKGRQKELATMCGANAAEFLAMRSIREEKSKAALEELAGLLGLADVPEYIESYDISHTSGAENVGVMVVFKNGKPLKSAYKRFKIKSFAGQDDIRSMREVLERRFSEYRNAESEDGFGKLPDLILLDGGHGQLNAVRELLDDMGIDVPVFGMVKDSKHKTSAIAADGGSVAIKSNRRAFNLLYTIQEEVHRFAISYHRERRSKSMLKSRLLDIEGIGQSKATTLMKHFGSIDKLSQSNEEEISGIKGISQKDAKNIIEYFKNE